MPFVQRDDDGRILALRRNRAAEAEEFLPAGHPELSDFVTSCDPQARPWADMRRSDLDMIRVYEDIVDLLLERKLILLTDLPEAAQQKLLRRKTLRTALSSIGDILAEDDGIL